MRPISRLVLLLAVIASFASCTIGEGKSDKTNSMIIINVNAVMIANNLTEKEALKLIACTLMKYGAR